jgi:hypothetical protein
MIELKFHYNGHTFRVEANDSFDKVYAYAMKIVKTYNANAKVERISQNEFIVI